MRSGLIIARRRCTRSSTPTIVCSGFMSSLTKVIKQQIDSLREAARNFDQTRAMAQFDLVDLIGISLALLTGLREIDRRYCDRVKSGAIMLNRDDFLAIQHSFEGWYTLA